MRLRIMNVIRLRSPNLRRSGVKKFETASLYDEGAGAGAGFVSFPKRASSIHHTIAGA